MRLGPPTLTAERPYTFTTTDEGPDGRVQFVTTADVTGQSLSDLPEAAIYRMLCIYIVTRLSEHYVKDACWSTAARIRQCT
jgi:hypothetical protein